MSAPTRYASVYRAGLFAGQVAFVTSASMLDDGIIDPRDTRNVLGFALSICKDGDARSVRPVQFGVARP